MCISKTYRGCIFTHGETYLFFAGDVSVSGLQVSTEIRAITGMRVFYTPTKSWYIQLAHELRCSTLCVGPGPYSKIPLYSICNTHIIYLNINNAKGNTETTKEHITVFLL